MRQPETESSDLDMRKSGQPEGDLDLRASKAGPSSTGDDLDLRARGGGTKSGASDADVDLRKSRKSPVKGKTGSSPDEA